MNVWLKNKLNFSGLDYPSLDLGFSAQCLLCGNMSEDNDICRACKHDLPFLSVSCCTCCAIPLPMSGVCGVCQQKRPYFDSTQAALHYAMPVDRLIQRLKFHRQLFIARILGQLLANYLVQTGFVRPDRLIPVPLHGSRLRQRGFNQSLEIAKEVSRRLSVHLDPFSCQRLRATGAQSELPARARAKNVRGAFAVIKDVQGQHITLLDDVMTTGFTAGELARTLKKAGARRVDVWLCARAYLT